MDSTKQEKKIEVYTISVHQESQNGKSPPRSSFCHIDKRMLRFKLHFFLMIASFGLALPYMTVIAKNRVGLSATSLAGLMTIRQFIFIATKPLIGYIADYFNKLKAIICILLIGQVASYFALLLIPQIGRTSTNISSKVTLEDSSLCDWQEFCKPLHRKKIKIFTNLTVASNHSSNANIELSELCTKNDYIHDEASGMSNFPCDRTLKINQSMETCIQKNEDELHFIAVADIQNFTSVTCGENSSRTCTVLNANCRLCCINNSNCSLFSCTSTQVTSDETIDASSKSDLQTYQFWSFAVIYTFGSICTNSLFTLSDTACCETVMRIGADFGRQRLFGGVGWGLGAVIGGYLRDLTGDYLVSWIVMGLLSVLTLFNLRSMDLVKPHFSQNILKDVGTVLSSKEYLAFAFLVTLNGVNVGILWFYFILFLNSIGGSNFLCGLSQTVQCYMGEIPFMFISGWVIKKLGHFNVLTLALSAYCIRFLWYSFLPSPWLVLPFECLHGLTLGVFYPAVASYGKLSAKPGTEATTQALLFTCHEGLGAGIGCVLAGIGMDRLDGYKTFFIASVFSGCGAVVSIILHMFMNHRKILIITS